MEWELLEWPVGFSRLSYLLLVEEKEMNLIVRGKESEAFSLVDIHLSEIEYLPIRASRAYRT